MKRLFQISLDILMTSALPVLLWIVLGMILRPEIANVFALTYPLQFVYMIFANVFAVGPNVTARKKKNNNVVFSNMMLGCLLVGVFTWFLTLNVDGYISLMNMEPEIYRNYCIYSIVLIFFSFVLQIISQKLYFEGKNKQSNIMNTIYHISNFLLIIILSMYVSEKIAIWATLIIDAIIVGGFIIKYFRYRKFELLLWDNIRNTSFGILDSIGMVLIYGVGFWNSFSYGQKYIDAINFEELTTDTQWDMLEEAIDTTAKIDLTSKTFNYRKSLKNAYKFVFILIGTILIVDAMLYWYYRPELWILSILVGVQIIDMLLRPLIGLRWNYLQIKDNSMKHNVVFLGIRFVTVLASFLPTAFCTYIGQLLTAGLEYIYAKIKCRNVKEFKLGKRN